MSAVLLDTHAWIWSVMAPARLGSGAKEAITGADAVFVSPISVYEVTRKARLGKWPEIIPHIGELVAEGQTISAPLTRAVAARAGLIDWRHRDPFDRLIRHRVWLSAGFQGSRVRCARWDAGLGSSDLVMGGLGARIGRKHNQGLGGAGVRAQYPRQRRAHLGGESPVPEPPASGPTVAAVAEWNSRIAVTAMTRCCWARSIA